MSVLWMGQTALMELWRWPEKIPGPCGTMSSILESGSGLTVRNWRSGLVSEAVEVVEAAEAVYGVHMCSGDSGAAVRHRPRSEFACPHARQHGSRKPRKFPEPERAWCWVEEL